MHVSDIFLGLVALLHFGFMVLESFLWQSNFAKKRFGLTHEVAATTANLAKNQGVYNLFLSAGLVFAQCYRGQDVFMPLNFFFLGCIVIAGILGALTVSSRIFVIQAVPAIIAGVLLALGL